MTQPYATEAATPAKEWKQPQAVGAGLVPTEFLGTQEPVTQTARLSNAHPVTARPVLGEFSL